MDVSWRTTLFYLSWAKCSIIKHQGKKLALLIERRKLAKKTRRQLTREDAEFFRDVKKMRTDEYAKACRARAKDHDDERRAIQSTRADMRRKTLAMEREALQRERRKEAAFLDGVVLPDGLRSRVLQLAIATRNAKTNRAPFRHMLLHGPPGTGKTLVAKRLAKASVSSALMSGGDVGPLGADGVTALHTLFRWARTSETGVLVLLMRPRALASRSRAKLTEHMRNALNAFPYQTGSPTTSFVLVLATNRAEDLDEAVLDRVDETLYFGPALQLEIN